MDEKQLSIFTFNDNSITFEFQAGKDVDNVMVNATEMAKIFNKRVENFTRIETTEAFINECLKNANKRFLGIENVHDLIVSKQKSGTWMHRILALKFAAWLSPAFELWVYVTIDKILFDYHRELEESLRKSAERKNRIDQLEEELQADDNFVELQLLQLQERSSAIKRGKRNRNRIDLFRGKL